MEIIPLKYMRIHYLVRSMSEWGTLKAWEDTMMSPACMSISVNFSMKILLK
jgi:hypothetical protein